MKQRIRITIEIDTEHNRAAFNMAAWKAANEVAKQYGELVYCATEYVTPEQMTLMDKRNKRRKP